MTRNSVVLKSKKPGLKEEKKVVKPASTAPAAQHLDYVAKLEKNGSGVPNKPKYNGEKPLRTVAAEHSAKKAERTVELLRQNGYEADASSIEIRQSKKREKAVYTKGEKKRILRKRNEQRQLDAVEEAFDREVAETWGQEKGEFATLADKETHEKRVEAGKKAAVTRKANQEASDRAYEQWYCETAFGGKSK